VESETESDVLLLALSGDFSQPFFKTQRASSVVTLETAQGNPLAAA